MSPTGPTGRIQDKGIHGQNLESMAKLYVSPGLLQVRPDVFRAMESMGGTWKAWRGGSFDVIATEASERVTDNGTCHSLSKMPLQVDGGDRGKWRAKLHHAIRRVHRIQLHPLIRSKNPTPFRGCHATC